MFCAASFLRCPSSKMKISVVCTSQPCKRFLVADKRFLVGLKFPGTLSWRPLHLTWYSYLSRHHLPPLRSTWLSLFHIICTWWSSFLSHPQELWCWFLTGKGCGTSLRLQRKLFCDLFFNWLQWSFIVAHWPHYEDRESDKYEEGATDADHRKCPKVDLTIACWTK